MRHGSDSDLGDWRRRIQNGARDIAFAVALTVLAVSLIALAWLGNPNHQGGREPVATAVKVHPN
jgi:hypothetical protein